MGTLLRRLASPATGWGVITSTGGGGSGTTVDCGGERMVLLAVVVATIGKLVGLFTIIKGEGVVVVAMLDVLVVLVDSLVSTELAVEEDGLIGLLMLLF